MASIGFCLFVAALIGLATSQPGSGKAAIGYALITGIGIAFITTQLPPIVQLTTPPEYIGLATALDISLRSVFGGIGGAIAGSILGNK